MPGARSNQSREGECGKSNGNSDSKFMMPSSIAWIAHLSSLECCDSDTFYFPIAIALGSSAIVKVSGQNCFWTLYGSLGQIRLGLPKGSAEGSTKVPPRFHQGSTKILQVSWCLWFSGSPSWAVKRFRGRFHRGFTKVAQVS